MTPYEEIAESIVQKQMLVLGNLIALERARRAQGMEVDDEGRVKKISGDAVEILEKLIAEYQELLGPAALSFARDAALPVIKKNAGLTLPRALQD